MAESQCLLHTSLLARFPQSPVRVGPYPCCKWWPEVHQVLGVSPRNQVAGPDRCSLQAPPGQVPLWCAPPMPTGPQAGPSLLNITEANNSPVVVSRNRDLSVDVGGAGPPCLRSTHYRPASESSENTFSLFLPIFAHNLQIHFSQMQSDLKEGQ